MPDGTYVNQSIAETTIWPVDSVEQSGADYRQQVEHWTKTLSKQPGWRGKLLRQALETRWC